MQLNSIIIREPQNPKEFEAYFLVRFELLRKPWNQPLGSEKDDLDLDINSIHLMAIDRNQTISGVCRLQFNSYEEAQLRYMAVIETAQGLGVGRKLLNYAEKKVMENRRERIVLQSRSNAVTFYEKCGYSVIEKSYLMWGEIQHYLMEKKL